MNEKRRKVVTLLCKSTHALWLCHFYCTGYACLLFCAGRDGPVQDSVYFEVGFITYVMEMAFNDDNCRKL